MHYKKSLQKCKNERWLALTLFLVLHRCFIVVAAGQISCSAFEPAFEHSFPSVFQHQSWSWLLWAISTSSIDLADLLQLAKKASLGLYVFPPLGRLKVWLGCTFPMLLQVLAEKYHISLTLYIAKFSIHSTVQLLWPWNSRSSEWVWQKYFWKL